MPSRGEAVWPGPAVPPCSWPVRPWPGASSDEPPGSRRPGPRTALRAAEHAGARDAADPAGQPGQHPALRRERGRIPGVLHDAGHLPGRPVAAGAAARPEGHQPAGRPRRGRRRAGHAGRRAVVVGLLAVQPPRPGRLPGRGGPGPARGKRAVPAAGAGPAGGGGPGQRAPAQPGAGTGRAAAPGQPRAGAQHGDSRPADQGGARGRGAGGNRPGGLRPDRPPGGHRGPLRQPAAGPGRTGPIPTPRPARRSRTGCWTGP